MAAPLVVKSPLLSPLAALSEVHKGGNAYYRALRNSTDPYVAVGAWCMLLEAKLVTLNMEREVFAYCRYGAVRSRAFRWFESVYEHDLARQAATTPVASAAEVEQRAMLAEVEQDHAAAAEAAGELYLASGDITHLRVASEQAELAAGWRASLEWALRAVVIAPLNAIPLQRLFMILESSAQPELIEEVAQILQSRNLHLQVMQIFLAGAAMLRGDAKLCLSRLKPLDDARIVASPVLKPYLGAVRALRAQAEDKLGEYRRAYDAFVALNAAERATDVNPEDFYKGVEIRGKLAVPPLPRDGHDNIFQMLGFPRSGTTLLENVLATHPDVETFEETSALVVAIERIERVLLGKQAVEPVEQTFMASRERYYGELTRLRKKPDARVLIDKMPIRTADTKFVAKLFPEWRYVFSIRHPYDVVLSCFKQRFTPNPAMENFRTIEGSIRLYDFAMTEWFSHHTMDDQTVHYVRYEELVTNFERVTRGVLEFLGVPWNDAVRDFAKTAENRAVKTPSYQKVRQGLSIGVQTQWRNYGFLFQSEAAKPLARWAEFFGYPTK
ncbi:MAG TPA: sulfotransferase [Devosia sp.]|nr:sulfotransferase [Devosia sp.]